MIVRLFCLVFLGGIWCHTHAQVQQLAASEYLLYTGKAYVQYPPAQEGSATFKNYNFDSDTDLNYHGQHYSGRMLMYDLVLDEVIIFHPEKEIPLILPKEWVDSFVIRQDTMVYLEQEDWKGLPSSGFYHKFYNSGGSLCFASYSKILRDVQIQGGRSRRFEETIRYFVRLNDAAEFQEITRHSQLLKLDPENRRANRRALYSLGLHTKDKLGAAISVVLSNIGRQAGE